jgi:N-acetylglutamate synthase-like GNAT family acetyltransferase
MVPFKIVDDGEIVGFCFLKRFNSRVFEIGLIGVLQSKRGLGIGSQAIDMIKKYVKKMGAIRLLVRASGTKQVAGFFTKCGFKQAFSEEVFFLDIT